MFFRKQEPAPHFAQGLFVLLLVIFSSISHVRPILGLTGLGVVLIIGSTLVLANSKRIWQDYTKHYKKLKRKTPWGAPLKIYYQINVYVLWPLLLILGIVALVGAYYAS
jgi:hypothetical protein